MKTIFLLPPSEGKNTEWQAAFEHVSFNCKKPMTLARNATEKDLKCTGKRYEEWISLNKKCVIWKSENYTEAINRYSGVMYNAIWYNDMFESGKFFFQNQVYVLSGMYGVLKATDLIWNYKLPIETKWLLRFWWECITEILQQTEADCIVNLLPLSYQKMIHFDNINAQIIHVNFYSQKEWFLKKMTHGVKKVKWEWLREICERQETNYNNFWWIVLQDAWSIEVQIIK